MSRIFTNLRMSASMNPPHRVGRASRPPIEARLVLAALLALGSLGAASAARLQVLSESSLQSTNITLPATGRALVEEVHRVAVPAGGGTFSLTWLNAKIDRASALLLPSDGLRVLGPRFPAGADKTVQWELLAPAGDGAEVRLIYAIDGLSFVPEYSLTLDPTGEAGQLVWSGTLTNDTGRRFENATVFVSGVRTTQPLLDPGQVITIECLRAPQVAFRRALVVDVARFGNAAAVLESFENVEGAGLGTIPLPAGKIRVSQRQADGHLRAIGDSTLARTPVGERAEFLLAFEQDIIVKRRMTLSRQINIRKDEGERVVAFDLEEEVCIDLESRLPDDVELQVIEHVEGHWDPVSASVPPERIDAGTISFPVTVPAFRTAQVRYRYVRRNLAP